MIRKLKRSDIDDVKWNELVANHSSSLPYAYTWYLDAVCEKWEAFVKEDYSAVMPLPIFKKYFFKVVYQPDFCQQLGVFTKQENQSSVLGFYAALKKHFFFYHVQQNFSFASIPDFQCNTKSNFELNLGRPFEQLSQNFNSNTKRNIQKAKQANLQVNINENFKDEFLVFYEKHVADNKSKVVEQLLNALDAHGMLLLPVVKDQSGKVLAANLMIKERNRIIHLIPVATEEGRQNGAMHFLLAEVIKQFSGSKIILDFEGSSIATIAQFYRGFGAEERKFIEIKKLRQGLTF